MIFYVYVSGSSSSALWWSVNTPFEHSIAAGYRFFYRWFNRHSSVFQMQISMPSTPQRLPPPPPQTIVWCITLTTPLTYRAPQTIRFVVIVKIQVNVRAALLWILIRAFQMICSTTIPIWAQSPWAVSLAVSSCYSCLYSYTSFIATIVNAALQSNTSRLRLDWPDNVRFILLVGRDEQCGSIVFV